MFTNRIEIFFSHQGNGQPLYLQSGDENSRYLELVLKQYNGITFEDIDTADYTATMVYRYINGSGPQSTDDITAERQEDGSFLTLIPIDPLLQTGEVKAQLSLRKVSEERVTKSAVLIINVLESLTADAGYTEQAVTQLTAVLAQVSVALEAAEGAAAATAAASDAAIEANNAAALANQSASDADDAAAAATQAASDADDAAAAANLAVQGADASAAAATQAASDADDAADAANLAAQGADTSAAAASQAASGADDAAAAANTAATGADTAAAQAIASKTSIKTVNTYADYATLQSSVPSPTPYTDYYAVGAAEPYDIYVYTASGWLNLGPIGGNSELTLELSDKMKRTLSEAVLSDLTGLAECDNGLKWPFQNAGAWNWGLAIWEPSFDYLNSWGQVMKIVDEVGNLPDTLNFYIGRTVMWLYDFVTKHWIQHSISPIENAIMFSGYDEIGSSPLATEGVTMTVNAANDYCLVSMPKAAILARNFHWWNPQVVLENFPNVYYCIAAVDIWTDAPCSGLLCANLGLDEKTSGDTQELAGSNTKILYNHRRKFYVSNLTETLLNQLTDATLLAGITTTRPVVSTADNQCLRSPFMLSQYSKKLKIRNYGSKNLVSDGLVSVTPPVYYGHIGTFTGAAGGTPKAVHLGTISVNYTDRVNLSAKITEGAIGAAANSFQHSYTLFADTSGASESVFSSKIDGLGNNTVFGSAGCILKIVETRGAGVTYDIYLVCYAERVVYIELSVLASAGQFIAFAPLYDHSSGLTGAGSLYTVISWADGDYTLLHFDPQTRPAATEEKIVGLFGTSVLYEKTYVYDCTGKTTAQSFDVSISNHSETMIWLNSAKSYVKHKTANATYPIPMYISGALRLALDDINFTYHVMQFTCTGDISFVELHLTVNYIK